jgi:hypothetical protein
MSPETLGALARLNMLDGETLPDRACELLEAGIDTQAVRELAGLHRPSLSEAQPLLQRALRELNVAEARPDDAILVALDFAERIIAGSMPADRGYEIGTLWRDHSAVDDLGRFYGLWAQWDDDPKYRPELKADILTSAKELLQAHGWAAA